MIIPDPNDAIYHAQFEEIPRPDITLFRSEARRVSEILGPDGDPLLVGFERPKFGFDLSPKGKAGK